MAEGFEGCCFVLFLDLFARNDGHPGCSHRLPCGHLVAHFLNRHRRRPNPRQARSVHGRRKISAFGKKSKPRVNGGRPGLERCFDDLLLVEVGFPDAFAVQEDDFIGHFGEQTSDIVWGAHGHGWVPGFPARPQNPARNLTSIRHQDLDAHPSSIIVGFPVRRSLFQKGRQPFLALV